MSKQTFVDWQSSSLVVASCSGRGPGTKVQKISHQLVSAEGEADSRSVSAALATAVKELGLSKTEATILAPREIVEVRTVSVPRIDPDELPDVIRFQAQRQFANMSDNWILDFVMLPQDPGQEMQTALVGAISPAAMSKLTSACTEASLQLAHVALAPMEIARFALSTGRLSGASNMVVCLSAEYADLLILKADQVVLVRGTKLPGEMPQLATAVAGEVRRSMMAASSHLASDPISQVLVIAAPELYGQLESPIAEAAGVPLSYMDPTDLLPASLPDREIVARDSANRIVAIAGAASLAGADKSSVIDFVNPKKRPPPRSNTLRYALSAAAAITLILAGGSWWYSTNSQLDDELASFEREIEDKKVLIEAAERKIAQFREIEYFLDRSPNFLDEITYISQKIPSSEKVLLGGPMCDILPDGRAQIVLPVAADEDTTISEFEATLRDENHEIVRRNPRRIDGATGLYAWETVETIRITNQGWNAFDDPTPVVASSAEQASDEEAAGELSTEETPQDASAEKDEANTDADAGSIVPDRDRQAAAATSDDSSA